MRDRGRDADSPTDMPALGWRDIVIRSWREAGQDNLSLVAAGVAFYGFLALVPLIGAVVLSYGLLADPATIVRTLESLTRMLPADAARLVGEQILSVTQTAQTKKGIGLVIALALALYGAMRGASAIMTALNIIYEEEEKRSFIQASLVALAITAGAVIAALLAAGAISALAYLDRLLPRAPAALLILGRLLSWLLLAAGAAAAAATVYRYGPSRNIARWRWLTPGSLFACLAWLLATFGFGLYVANLGNYNATYGSLGAVVVLLMWLYLSAYVLLLGAEFNAELEHQTARDTTGGVPAPMGKRGAVVADTLGEIP
ncbi:ribonuclease BN [Sphingomonas oleivorans]|uniref:Ribonuclease BN n=1 Tax=Sphingomonas oleivorans TaxID=1735121 RepID=A0A2T5G2C5_9SPHN|nr:YihY/virulence factor BrkB family protein [Sphingomonas oleivorans]PTQ13303.1 ribonuclease BN [Sphingomonas oleivorans]